MDSAAGCCSVYVATVYNWAAVPVPAYKPTNRFIDHNVSNAGEESGGAPPLSLLEEDLVRLNYYSSCCISGVALAPPLLLLLLFLWIIHLSALAGGANRPVLLVTAAVLTVA